MKSSVLISPIALRWMSAGIAILGAVLEADVGTPQLSPTTADSPVGLDVSVSCATPDAEIHYTLNGAEPTRFDPQVATSGTIRVSRNAVVKAKAWTSTESSATVTEDYRITGAVISGDQHGLALSVSGRVWSWGNQNYGKLGNGLSTNDQVLNPIQVFHGSGNFETGAGLAAGFTHSLVQDQQGAVWSFGRNDAGQLGNNTTTDSSVPLQVKLSDSPLTYLTGSRAIAAGQDWSMVLQTDGSLLSWGSQATGRLGGSASGNRLLPGAVQRGDDGTYPALTGIRGIAAGPAFGLAREAHALEVAESTGKAWSWGYNNTGQLGLGHTTNGTRAMPVKLDSTTLLTDVLDLSAGEAHAVFLRWHATDPALQGTVWASGNRAYGRIGNGSTAAGSVTYPTLVLKAAATPLDQIEQVAAGAAHTLALDKSGHVWSWGYNGYGQLGDGSNDNSAYAIKVKAPEGGQSGVTDPYLANIVRVAAGGDGLQGASMALAADGTIYVWGRNNQGQLGNGETSLYATKLPVAHAQNHVAEGAPSLTLSYSVTDSIEDGSISITATPAHSGTGGIANIDRVEIFLNGQPATTFGDGTWSGSVGSLEAGSYHGYGVVYDDEGLMAMSAPFSFEIELDPAGDKDGDGLSNATEVSLSTDPYDSDTDDDGMEDGYEQWNQFSPLVIEIGTKGPGGDFDGDGMSNKNEHDAGRIARFANEYVPPADILTGSIRWFGRTGFWYTPQYSTDLINWTTFPMGFMGQNQEIAVDLVAWFGGPLPTSGGFYVRLKYGPAETEDFDGDGLSASAEFAAGTDATKADTDGDGIADRFDAAAGDKAIQWQKSDHPLFALFPVTGTGPIAHVNDQGRVLYRESVWHNGAALPLNPASGALLSGCYAIGIGDNGFILGIGEIDPPGDAGVSKTHCLVTWPVAGGDPVPLMVEGNYLVPVSVPDPNNAGIVSFPAPSDMNVNPDGKFVAHLGKLVSGPGPGGNYTTLQADGASHKIWQGTAGNSAVTLVADAGERTVWIAANGLECGTNDFGNFKAGNQVFYGAYSRIAMLPGDGLGAFSDGTLNPYILDPSDSTWKINNTLRSAIDVSAEGRFALQHPWNIWLDSANFRPGHEMAPGLPAAWQGQGTSFADTSRHGWTLALKQDVTPSQAMLGMPLRLSTDTPASGLDNQSAAASDSTVYSAGLRAGNKDEFWIMVPAGGTTTVRVKSTASATVPVLIDQTGPVTTNPVSLTGPDQTVTLSAPASAAGQEFALSLKIGSSPSASAPIRVKVMKPRVVNVSVYPLKRPNFTDTNPPSNLPTLPTEADMEAYLNGVFQPQVAVTFNVTPANEGLMAADPGQYFDPVTIPLATLQSLTAGKTDGHIQVFITGGYLTLGIPDPKNGFQEGWTPTGGNQIWLPVGPLVSGDAAGKERWLHNLAHETGHVLWGAGHPNSLESPGKAALPGTDRSIRLMYTHQAGAPPKLIVKAEWDGAEKWLIDNVD